MLTDKGLNFTSSLYTMMSLLARTLPHVSILTALLAVSSEAHASGAGHVPSIGDLTFYWVNFVLYVALMTYLLRKPIKNGWAARTARIKQTVADCTDQVESAERELNAIEALTKGLPAEQERARQQIVSQANLEAADIVKQAEQRAARLREQSKEMLKGEMRSAQSSFRASLVSRALQLAKDRFTKGEYAAREQAYVGAAVTRAKQLVQ
jgi:F0F1-type ATP synthase membrane subunit b/b'